MKILLIDNYDSFTFNIYQYLLELKQEVICKRNDEISISDVGGIDADAIFISPGPGNPSEAGNCLDIVRHYAGKISIFGICLGHQIIAQAFGGKIIHAKNLFHGKTSRITSLGKGIFSNFENEFIATRYHSLLVEKESLPECFEITCQVDDDEIMGIKHKEFNIEGVQFHPESIMTEQGKKMLINFLDRTVKKLDKCSKDDIKTDVVGMEEKKNFSKKPFQVIDFEQKEFKYKMKTNFFSLFENIQKRLGGEKSCLLDSVNGPEADCNHSFMGVFPVLDIVIQDRKMEIKTENTAIEKAFNNNFFNLYNEEKNIYDLGDYRFSDIFSTIRQMFTVNGKSESPNFSFGLIGYFSYEYLHYLEKISRPKKTELNMPDIHLVLYSNMLTGKKDESEIILYTNVLDKEEEGNFEKLKDILSYDKFEPIKYKQPGNIEKLESNTTPEEYYKMVEKAIKYIKDGDIFQVQLGRRLRIQKDIEGLEIYSRLREINPSPYMFYWDRDDIQLISNSPELQLKIEDHKVVIRPIAGTSHGKGKSKEESIKLKNELLNSAKEQAEHIMLVDLARNDIGRVAIPGSVEVTKLMSVEEFSHVYHLISNVTGTIEEQLNSMKLFECTFPAGTLTGAPKVRAMEIISELEKEERGPYGGVFGLFDFNGNIISSIIIRTVLRKGKDLYLQAAAGIVADSIDRDEWNEINYKTQAIKQILEESEDF